MKFFGRNVVYDLSAVILFTGFMSSILSGVGSGLVKNFVTGARAAEENVLYVAPTGSDSSANGSSDKPLKTITFALNLALPGTTIYVKEGTYAETITTVRSGEVGKPITLQADGPVKLVGGSKGGKIMYLFHSNIKVIGFEFDGTVNDIDTILWIEGAANTHFKNNFFHNANSECIRMLFFSHDNAFINNTVQICGETDYNPAQNHKNGEGIYVGTAPEQMVKSKYKNPANQAKFTDTSTVVVDGVTYTKQDKTNTNIFRANDIFTNGNECVDIKEYSSGNIVEDNYCRGQRDPESGGFDSRGDHNIFRFNKIGTPGGKDILGAAIRTGGDVAGQSLGNEIQNNQMLEFSGVQNVAVNIQRGDKQGLICGNTNVSGAVFSTRFTNDTISAQTPDKKINPVCAGSSFSGPRICVGYTCVGDISIPTSAPKPTVVPSVLPTLKMSPVISDCTNVPATAPQGRRSSKDNDIKVTSAFKPAPVNFIGCSPRDSVMILVWSQPAGEVPLRYKIYEQAPGSLSFVYKTTATVTSIQLGGQSKKEYKYKISAVYQNGLKETDVIESVLSAPISVMMK